MYMNKKGEAVAVILAVGIIWGFIASILFQGVTAKPIEEPKIMVVETNTTIK